MWTSPLKGLCTSEYDFLNSAFRTAVERRRMCPLITFSHVNVPFFFFFFDKGRCLTVLLEERIPIFDFPNGNSINFKPSGGAVMARNFKALGFCPIPYLVDLQCSLRLYVLYELCPSKVCDLMTLLKLHQLDSDLFRC